MWYHLEFCHERTYDMETFLVLQVFICYLAT
jgi:hypothetical protein